MKKQTWLFGVTIIVNLSYCLAAAIPNYEIPALVLLMSINDSHADYPNIPTWLLSDNSDKLR